MQPSPSTSPTAKGRVPSLPVPTDGPARSLPESSLQRIRLGASPRVLLPRSGTTIPVVSSAQWLLEHVRRRWRPPRIDRCFAFDGDAKLKLRSRDLLPCTDHSLTTRRNAMICGSRATEPRSGLRALRSIRNGPRGGLPPEHSTFCGKMEAPPGFEPGMEVLQISSSCRSC